MASIHIAQGRYIGMPELLHLKAFQETFKQNVHISWCYGLYTVILGGVQGLVRIAKLSSTNYV
jgi:hypothetical protein